MMIRTLCLSGAFLVLAGCGGSSRSVLANSAGGATTESGGVGGSTTGSSGAGGATTGGAHALPIGRPELGTCPASQIDPDDANGGSLACSDDADCDNAGFGLNTHCLNGQCGDECLTDSDCPNGQACGCAAQFRGNAIHTNACVLTGCRVDADCGPSGVCSDSESPHGCGGLNGYYCHAATDTCSTDADCAGNSSICAYQATLGHWACQAKAVCTG